MSIVFVKSVEKIDMYGSVFDFRKPTVGELKNFNSKLAAGESEFELMCSFLTALGVPKKILTEMEMGHMITLVERAMMKDEPKK